jgi:hypothetical protein
MGVCIAGFSIFLHGGEGIADDLHVVQHQNQPYFTHFPFLPYAKKLSEGEKALPENYTFASPFLLFTGSHLREKLEPIIAHLITHQMNGIFNGNGKSSNMCKIFSSCIARHVANNSLTTDVSCWGYLRGKAGPGYGTTFLHL